MPLRNRRDLNSAGSRSVSVPVTKLGVTYYSDGSFLPEDVIARFVSKWTAIDAARQLAKKTGRSFHVYREKALVRGKVVHGKFYFVVTEAREPAEETKGAA